MKTEFILVSSIDYVSFQDRVNKLLGKGYLMVGAPFSHGNFVCLGMVRTTESAEPQPAYPVEEAS